MSVPSRLYFVEEISDRHYTFRYGANVFALIQHPKHWCFLHNGCTVVLDSDNLHDALYHAIGQFQKE